jgi:hypothetical protein
MRNRKEELREAKVRQAGRLFFDDLKPSVPKRQGV